MTDVVLFHHAQGCTDGVRSFADRLRSAGHRVIVPDLYDGATFATLDEGMAHAQQIGFDTLVERGEAAVADMPPEIVYAGMSLGALPTQKLAQTRPGARAAVLYHGAVPASAFGGTWPDGVALQAHVNEHDALGDQDVMEELVGGAADAELFTYPGSTHLFTDASLGAYDPASTGLAVERTLSLLDRWS